MYKINTANGDITRLSDGFVITAPYDEPEYLEYADWVIAGNTPEEFYQEVKVVPETVSRFQARAALYVSGYLATIEQVMQDINTPMLSKLAWQDAQEFRRDSTLANSMGQFLGLTSDQLDDLFIQAASIVA
jgi:hypothetical protein